MRVEFGSYVQIFEDNDPSNILSARSTGAIALTPTGNAQGDYFYMSLATGKKLSRHSWTVLPITDTAIARVEKIALHQKQPLLQASGLVVEWRPDQLIDDDEYDFEYAPPQRTHRPRLASLLATTMPSTTTATMYSSMSRRAARSRSMLTRHGPMRSCER